MSVHKDQPGPYTSAKALIGIVQKCRDKGLPTPIDLTTLMRAGITESLAPRTLQSLRVLDLITEKGEITPVFESLRLASESEFKDRVKHWLDTAYADILQFIDPASASETNVRDAFRNYRPTAQQDRMVALFMRLYEFAGVSPPKAVGDPSGPRVKAFRVTAKTQNPAPKFDSPRRHVAPVAGLPPALAGLLQSLPLEGDGWSKARRDAFVNTFSAVIDFCFPVVVDNDEGSVVPN